MVSAVLSLLIEPAVVPLPKSMLAGAFVLNTRLPPSMPCACTTPVELMPKKNVPDCTIDFMSTDAADR